MVSEFREGSLLASFEVWSLSSILSLITTPSPNVSHELGKHETVPMSMPSKVAIPAICTLCNRSLCEGAISPQIPPSFYKTDFRVRDIGAKALLPYATTMSTTKLQPILLRGICACEATTWTSTAAPTHLDFCYCTTCQRVTGSPFGAWMGISKSSITWEGPIAKYKVSDMATRSLCVQCGGTLSIQYDCYPEKTHVAAGMVADGALLVPKVGVHIFVSEKPKWYNIPDDDVLRWEGFDDEFNEQFRAHKAKKSG